MMDMICNSDFMLSALSSYLRVQVYNGDQITEKNKFFSDFNFVRGNNSAPCLSGSRF